jgi:hypothetical protein
MAPAMPADAWPATAMRERAYAVGGTLAALLERTMPAWRDTLEAQPRDSATALDVLLARALARTPDAGAGCALDAAERRAHAARAATMAAGVAAERAEARARVVVPPGWRVVVESPRGALSLQGFDPLNVLRVAPAEVVHRRMLTLGGAAGGVELLGTAALTEGAPGGHPLFAGVRRVTSEALRAAPVVRDSAGTTLVEAPGVRVRARGAALDTVARAAGARDLRVRLP